MADTPAPPPTPEGEEPVQDQRLTVPESTTTEVVSADRFTSAPSTRAFALTPERAAQVVRQSSNARWVGFLTVVVVILFVSIYWFYELGAPLGLTQPRLEAEGTAQAITKVERGYNIYQANCARCHGEQGLGPNDEPPGIGPALNRQDKLFAHLNEDYLNNVLTVGGRYVCGNPNSQMPVWADTNGGPLNYRQIEELIAFLRAPNDQDFIIRDEHLLDAKVDPVTGEVMTFTGWRDPNYEPEPGATPFPACWTKELEGDGGSPAPSTPAGSADPDAAVVEISTTSSTAFDQSEVTAPADTPFTIHFSNEESGVLHNVEIKDDAGASLVQGDFVTGVAEADYSVPALAAGDYTFICSVHPNMTGTLTAE